MEEFTLPDGRVITFSRCRFARSTEKVLEAKIPKVRLVDGKTYVDYEEYMENKENKESKLEQEGKNMENSDSIGYNDDLPF